MTRRLSELSEANLEEAGRSAEKAVHESGFDEELKQKLLNRIADASFKNENKEALAEANLTSTAGQGTRSIASAKPWSGTESTEDAAMRMLDDSYKRIRRPAKIPSPAAQPPRKVDTGRPKKGPSSGVRLANARDKSSMYSSHLQDDNLSEEEKAQFRQELKDKFTPSARSLPTTLRGLTSLANERIEDAIARGQFKNIPRGQKIERDYTASSPFLDTTEYFMNKIIQRQEIVPPWIEKQQELVQNATKFRSRLRADWRRHAARLISSRGGSLEAQVLRAQEYARAEAIINPPATKRESLNAIDDEGHVSQISLSGQLKAPDDGATQPEVKINVSEQPATTVSQDVPPPPDLTQAPTEEGSPSEASDDPRIIDGAVYPFRDASWEGTERSYHNLAIEELNTQTRSYNLMAPNLAKKPYFSLERELKSCFADIAPQLPSEILERARAPKVKIEMSQGQSGGVLDHIGGPSARVYDEKRPQYGFKEFWRDVFGKKEAT